MKISNFLRKIKKQKQLEIVKPSEEIMQSYLENSKSYISSAKMLFKVGKLKEPTQLVYFSIYYSLLGLLFKIGIKSENHLASAILLKEIFDIDNSFILDFRKRRIETYYPDFEIEKKALKKLIQDAEEFNEVLFDFISKITKENIKIYQNKLKDVLT